MTFSLYVVGEELLGMLTLPWCWCNSSIFLIPVQRQRVHFSFPHFHICNSSLQQWEIWLSLSSICLLIWSVHFLSIFAQPYVVILLTHSSSDTTHQVTTSLLHCDRSVARVSQSCGFREMEQHICNSMQTILPHLLPSLTNGLETLFLREGWKMVSS